MRNALVFAHLHDIQHLMQPVKIRQFRQKAQNQRQFGRGMVAKKCWSRGFNGSCLIGEDEVFWAGSLGLTLYILGIILIKK